MDKIIVKFLNPSTNWNGLEYCGAELNDWMDGEQYPDEYEYEATSKAISKVVSF